VPVVPVPLIVVKPTDSVTVQVPVAGNPLNAILPVAAEQVGWVTAPNVGADGVKGCAFTVTVAEDAEVHEPTIAVKV
jgi:hypothetical protein